jgi:FkbM family methyltransferase
MRHLKKSIMAGLKRCLPVRARNALFHIGFNVAPEEFRKFANLYAYAPDMGFGLGAAARLGFAPRTIVDVGAFEGAWSLMAKAIWPSADLIMIEPNGEKQSILQGVARRTGARVICELLGAAVGKEVEFVLMESGSSVFEERSDVPRERETRRLRTLDSVIPENVQIDLLKIDAQGYELEILAGAERQLPSIPAVILEVSLIEINKGAPLLHDVVAYMKQHGFVAYDILEIHRRPLDRALNQLDFLFLREDHFLRTDKRHHVGSATH